MTDNTNIPELMHGIGEAAKDAARQLTTASTEAKNDALSSAAGALRRNQNRIMSENAKDIAFGEEKGLTKAMLDRLTLDEGRIEAMAKGLDDIVALPDPVGAVTDVWDRPNGLQIERRRTPLGVIGVIYESRPNVTADAGALCLKAGNAAILRGGSESFHSSGSILKCLAEGLQDAGLPAAAVQRVPTRDRAAVGEMLTMVNHIDVIVPRGGKSLIERVSAESRVPLFKHLEGICHTYVTADADPEMAQSIVLNAKMRRTGICGATETLLIDRGALSLLTCIVDKLADAGCEVRGDADAQDTDKRVVPASDEDWNTEYLDSIISVRTVDGLTAAVDHIAEYGSNHTEAIITENADTA
ncbi:MAG: glutamate-5-semialdehyde dehydrogenase, partial [Rhodospirillales bacterium]|nr:glutamate-5-semialdehyde dehydrogenase [Rhodospirillales bacterium]